MEHRLKSSFDKLEQQRVQVVRLLKESDPVKVAQLQAGKWSPAQIIFHIIISEKLALQYMRKKYLGIGESKKTGLWEAFKFVVLKISQRLPLKFKAPKILGELDPLTLQLDQLEHEWTYSRNELKSFLEKFDSDSVRRQVYKHPFAGKLNILQGIDFMREHIIHHLPQIRSRIR
jgi:hypothetical protein